MASVKGLTLTVYHLIEAVHFDYQDKSKHGTTYPSSGDLQQLAKQTEEQLSQVVSSSFRIFQPNDPRPAAREVQMVDMKKRIFEEL